MRGASAATDGRGFGGGAFDVIALRASRVSRATFAVCAWNGTVCLGVGGGGGGRTPLHLARHGGRGASLAGVCDNAGVTGSAGDRGCVGVGDAGGFAH